MDGNIKLKRTTRVLWGLRIANEVSGTRDADDLLAIRTMATQSPAQTLNHTSHDVSNSGWCKISPR